MKPTPARAALAENLLRLMAANPDVDTQAKLAKRSGVAQSTVGRILRCDVSATVDNIGAIAQALGVDPGELVGNVNNRVENDSYLYRVPSGLSEFAHNQIKAFIRFTISEYAELPQAGLSFQQNQETASGQKAAVRRAMRKPLDEGTFNLDETHAPTERAGRKPKRGA